MNGLVLVMGVMVALAAFARETECKALCLDQELPKYEVEEDSQTGKDSQTEEDSLTEEYSLLEEDSLREEDSLSEEDSLMEEDSLSEEDSQEEKDNHAEEDSPAKEGSRVREPIQVNSTFDQSNSTYRKVSGGGTGLGIGVAPDIKCPDNSKRGRDGVCHKAFFVQPSPGT